MLTDIEIAQACAPKRISEIAEKVDVPDEYLEMYGKYKAKVDYNLLKDQPHEPGKLVSVTVIDPTPAGEGKTTGDGRLGRRAFHQGRERGRRPSPDESRCRRLCPLCSMWRASVFQCL